MKTVGKWARRQVGKAVPADSGRRADVPTCRLAALLLLPIYPSAHLLAQCPDGAPPPCAQASRSSRVRPPTAEERGRRFLVLPFRNLSRSPEHEWLVEGSTTMLVDALGRWQDITVVPDERLYPALRRLGVEPGAIIDPAKVRRLAEGTGGWTAVTGEVLATGGRIRVTARAYDVVSNRELVRAAAELPAEGDVRVAFERIGTRLLRTAGLDTATIDLGDVTTRSLDAYRAYLQGIAHANRAEYRRARDAFLQAVGLDSMFAQAQFQLAYVALFAGPAAIFDPQSLANRALRRAVELADRLPPRRRDVVLAIGALFQGRFAASREILERLVAQDSNDVRAVGWLSFLEYVDPILVPDGQGGERRRGSYNRQLRLAKRALELSPASHDAYIPLVYTYALAAGDMPGVVPTYRREIGDIGTLFTSMPALIFIPLMQDDSIVLILADSIQSLGAEAIATARQNALGAARAWADRWLAAGPTEAEAHRAVAKVFELEGDYSRALVELDRADSLGAEFGYQDIRFRRFILLGKMGRYTDAAQDADSLWATGLFDHILITTGDQVEALAWAFNLFLLGGRFARADTAISRLATRLVDIGIIPNNAFATAAALRILSGSPLPPLWMLELPAAFRVEVMDSLHTRRASLPPESPIGRALPLLAGLASAAASDSVLRARVEAAPWFRRAEERRQ